MTGSTQGGRVRRTVELALPGYLGFPVYLEVEGYEVEVAGFAMVAHRAVADAYEHRLSKTYWTVTEPTTGRSISDGKASKARSIYTAIRVAEEVIADHGGPDALRAQIEKRKKHDGRTALQEGQNP